MENKLKMNSASSVEIPQDFPNTNSLMKGIPEKELKIAIKNRNTDQLIKSVLLFAAVFSVIVVFAQIIFLFQKAAPAIPYLDFGKVWNPTGQNPSFGMFPLVVGSLLTTVGAMIIAVPIGISVAIFISEIAPPKLKAFFKGTVEILAGIPSVIYGFFGLTVLTLGLQNLFNKPTGQSVLAGSIILAIMALPTIVSVSEDAMSVVPIEYREASLAVGGTKWQTISGVVVPSASSGITTAIILGMGRAIGETMAVLMVTGNSALIPDPITDVWSRVRTITATLAIEVPESDHSSIYFNQLFFLVVLLFGIIIFLNLIAEIVLARLQKKFRPDLLKEKKNRKSRVSRNWYKLVKRLAETEIYQKISAFNNKQLKPFLRKYKGKIYETILYIFLYILLQSWFFWPLAFLGIISIYLFRIIYQKLTVKTQQRLMFSIMGLAFFIVFATLAFMILKITIEGIPYLTWEFLTGYPTNGGREGGILPAIMGTFYLVLGSVLFAVPLGILAGIYLAEYSKDSGLTRIIRMGIDNLNGTPSIVFGLFGYTVFVLLPHTNKSLLAGAATLSLMILPTVIRTAEEAVRSINPAIKEGSLALGATKWYTVKKVVLPSAMPGVITGVILGMGRAAGETAPIMFTCATQLVQSVPTSLNEPVMVLSYHLYYLSQFLPNSDPARYATALTLLMLVLLIYGVAMLIRSRIKGKTKANFFY